MVVHWHQKEVQGKCESADEKSAVDGTDMAKALNLVLCLSVHGQSILPLPDLGPRTMGGQ